LISYEGRVQACNFADLISSDQYFIWLI
jgi:hypothetical protein